MDGVELLQYEEVDNTIYEAASSAENGHSF